MNALPPRIKHDSGKVCPTCGGSFYRDTRKHGNKQWAARVHCSRQCASHKPLWSRLEERVEIQGDCWAWVGPKDHDGYGRITVTNGGVRTGLRAHRASYEVYVGAIPKGLIVRHTCDNPSCINPLHLRLGTHADNAADKVARGRVSRIGKLTEDCVRAIRRSTLGVAALAAHYGVTRQSIKYARSGKTWGATA